jgi:hypothetical protein
VIKAEAASSKHCVNDPGFAPFHLVSAFGHWSFHGFGVLSKVLSRRTPGLAHALVRKRPYLTEFDDELPQYPDLFAQVRLVASRYSIADVQGEI